MNKIKIISLCLLVPFVLLIAFTFLKIKEKEEFKQKTVLAKEMRKALDHLMLDIYQAPKGSLKGVPADGLWHKGRPLLIADNIIGGVRIRRQKAAPDILEVEIKVQKNVSLISNFKVRIRQ